MGYLIKLGKKKELGILSLIYMLSQGFLIIVSGRWWDDWCLVDQPYQVLWNMHMQLGHPEGILIIKFAKFLPEPGYRVITFLMFYGSMLFLYKTLREWLSLSDKACFWICALYAVIPANDARIMLICFQYSIAVFFFMAGMSYLADKLNKRPITWKNRIVCYFLFITAFTVESTLVFYAMVLLMILMKERNIRGLMKYVDFAILPIAFFVIENKLFPAYGGYAGDNSVTIDRLIEGVKNIFSADIKMVKSIVYNFISIGNRFWLCIVAVLVLVFIIMNRKKIWSLLVELFCNKDDFETEEKKPDILVSAFKENVLILVIGVLALSAGLFAYVVVRGTDDIRSVEVGGRDSTLVAFGMAMILYALYSLVLKGIFKTYMLAGTIMSGIVFFNMWYISYQQDYYRQLGFQYQLTQHRELEDAYNIIYLNDDPGRVNIQRFYALNGNLELVFGVDDKLIMSGFSGTSILQGELLDYFVESGNYHMDSYDSSNKRIDAVVDYSFNGGGGYEMLKLKVLEIFSYSRFEDKLHRCTDMVAYMDGTEEYEQILANNGYENLE